LQLAEEDQCPQAWQNLIPIVYEDFSLTDDDIDVLVGQCLKFYRHLRSETKRDPHMIQGTSDQPRSEVWFQRRRLLFTASTAKRVLGLSTVDSKTNFVREHLWGIGGFEGNDATRHGQDNEATARACYLNAILQEHPGAKIVQTGKAYGRSESNSKYVFDMDEGTGVSQVTCRITVFSFDDVSIEIPSIPWREY